MSIEVTDDLVANVARLSRLALSAEESREIRTHLRKVLDFVEELQGLDLEGVDPSFFAVDASNVDREDEPRPSLTPGEALANAPERRDSCFVVPRIIADGGGAS